MKVYAFAVLLVFCIIENISAQWQDDVKIRHLKQIDVIVNRQLSNIQNYADKKGTPAAQQCVEPASQELKTISDRGYSGVSNCVSTSESAEVAKVCAEQVEDHTFVDALDVSISAAGCINEA